MEQYKDISLGIILKQWDARQSSPFMTRNRIKFVRDNQPKSNAGPRQHGHPGHA